MRRYQRDYFRTRSGSSLEYAKQYERIIDEELQKMRKRAEKAERELKELREEYGDNR